MKKDFRDFPSRVVDYLDDSRSSKEQKESRSKLTKAKKIGLFFGLSTLASSLAMSQVLPKQEEVKDIFGEEEADSGFGNVLKLNRLPFFGSHLGELGDEEYNWEAEVEVDIFDTEEPSFESPYQYTIVNDFMREHGLTTKDIFYPDPEKINDFNELFTSNEILPIFSDSVMQWSDLVERKCSEYNALNPEYTINPNFILAIMSIESQGRPVVESDAGAQGLLQVMPITAFSILYPGVDSQEFEKHEAEIIRELSNPEKNLDISLKYFKQLLQAAKNNALDGAIKWEYVSMKYNGGWNADKYFETSEFFSTLTNSEKAESYLSVKDMDGVKEVLLNEFGSITADGYEYQTYGPKMVKKETLKYGEKLLRFVVIAQMAAELKNNGASDEEIREILETPQVVKDIMGKIKEELSKVGSNPDYFQEREIYERYLTEDLDINSLSNSYMEDRSNPANFLMYP